MSKRNRDKPLTATEILAAAKIPTYELGIDRVTGDAVARVSGVPKTFDIVVPRAILVDAAPFGKPSEGFIRQFVHHFVQQECAERGLI